MISNDCKNQGNKNKWETSNELDEIDKGVNK